MSLSSRPVQPVPPESMELVFFYRCPGLWAPQSSDCADAAFHDPLRVLRGAFPRHAGGRTHRALRQDHARQRPRRSGP